MIAVIDVCINFLLHSLCVFLINFLWYFAVCWLFYYYAGYIFFFHFPRVNILHHVTKDVPLSLDSMDLMVGNILVLIQKVSNKTFDSKDNFTAVM